MENRFIQFLITICFVDFSDRFIKQWDEYSVIKNHWKTMPWSLDLLSRTDLHYPHALSKPCSFCLTFHSFCHKFHDEKKIIENWVWLFCSTNRSFAANWTTLKSLDFCLFDKKSKEKNRTKEKIGSALNPTFLHISFYWMKFI